ncbi:MAG: serine/threonine protein kinase [Deltaproteobacteria bacterium]
MGIPQVADPFLTLLKKSGLLPADEVAAALERFHLGPEAPPKEVARAFVRSGHLTRFQAERLLEGRYRGFFIDHYKVLEILGAGGMACLYLAEDLNGGERVALKVMADIHKTDAAMLARLKIEARAGKRLRHSGIIRTFGIHRTDDVFGEAWYLVMEYVEGINLEELINLKGPIPVAQACDFIWQAAAALQHAHAAGLVHRDVKPGNLLVDRHGTVKILDFGLALLDGEESNADEFSLAMIFGHSCLGTADYIAPEQSRDSFAVDSRADIYSLGCTLYVALSGKLPYPMASSCQKLEGHRMQPPPPLRGIAPAVSEELAAVVEKMMAKRPEDRYQTMAEVVEALTPFIRRQPVEFDFPKVLAWRAKDARRRFASQRRTGDSAARGPAKSPGTSKYSLRSASTKRLPQASADTSVEALPRDARSAVSLAAPFEGGLDDASLSRPEAPLVGPHSGPVLVPLEGGPAVPLAGNSVVIGRDPDCDVRIASAQVSGKHCELRSDGSVWRVVDLGSKNGTQVNGATVAERILHPGDRLSLSKQHHFCIDYPVGPHAGAGRLAQWALLGTVATAAALTGLFLWRVFG